MLCAIFSAYTNIRRSKRNAQSLYPVLGVIAVIVLIVFLDRISNAFQDLVRWLGNNVSFLSFLNNFNYVYGITYLLNALIILAFILLKQVLRPIMLKLYQSRRVTKFLSGTWYECIALTPEQAQAYNSMGRKKKRKSKRKKARAKRKKREQQETEETPAYAWFVKRSLCELRQLFMWLYIGSIVVSCLLFIIAGVLADTSVFSAPFYPALGVLIIGEIYFFLNGYTYHEAEQKEVVKPLPTEVNYESLRPQYEKTFAARLEESGKIAPIAGKTDASLALIEKYEAEAKKTNSHDAKLLAEYIRLLSARKDVDENLMSSVERLLNGESVLFSSPFYEKVTDYIFIFLLRRLMENKRILLVLGRNGAEENVVDWMKRGLAGVNGFDGLWSIAEFENADASSDIIYLPLRHIYEQSLFEKQSALLREVGVVIVFDASKLLGTMQMGLSVLVNYVRKGNRPQYIVFDRNCDGLVDSLSHVLFTSIEEVVPTSRNHIECGEMIWNADGAMLQYKLDVNTSRYFGMGVELAMLAVRNTVSKVSWLSYEKFPNRDMRWIMLQYYVPICKALGIPESKSALSERIDLCADPWSMQVQKNAYLVIEDEYNNIYETARQFSALATDQEFIHIISQNYLLKDYMAANADLFRDDPKAIPNIVPDYQRSSRNSVYKVVMRLIAGELPEEELEDLLALSGMHPDEDATAEERLAKIILDNFEIPEQPSGSNGIANRAAPQKADLFRKVSGVIKRESRISENGFSLHEHVFYSICNRTFIDEILPQLKISYYVAEDATEKGVLGARLYGHVHQDFLPGMFLTLNGKYYEVLAVSKERGVEVRRSSDHLTGRKYYRQIRHYDVGAFRPLQETASQKQYGKVSFEIGEAPISVDTIGYYELSDYGDMKNARKVLINGVETRRYKQKVVMRVKLEGSTPEVRTTIAVMLNEIFVTLFPDLHNFICAAVQTDAQKASVTEGYLPSLCAEDGDAYIYIIEDSLIDLGLLICVNRYFMRLLDIICDLLTWHKEQMDEAQGASDGEESPFGGSGEPDGGTPEAPETDGGTSEPEANGAVPEGEPGTDAKKPKGRFGAWRERRKQQKEAKKAAKKAAKEEKEAAREQENAERDRKSAERERKRAAREQEKAERERIKAERKRKKEERKKKPVPAASPDDPAAEKPDENNVRPEEPSADTPEDVKPVPEPSPEEPNADTPDAVEPVSETSFEEPDADTPEDVEPAPETSPEEPNADTPDAVEPAPETSPEEPNADTPEDGEPAPETSPEEPNADTPEDEESAPEISPEEPNADTPEDGEPGPLYYRTPDRASMILRSEGDMEHEGDQDEVDGEDAVAKTVDVERGTMQSEDVAKPYAQRHFLLYGFEHVPEFLALDQTRTYLDEIGLQNNYLHQSRRNKKEAEQQKYYNWRFEPGKHYCDFCGKQMTGKMDVLPDGRERCSECSSSAVGKLREYKRIYKQTRKKMAALYHITIRTKIKVKLVDAQQIAQNSGREFVPTPGFDGRVLGYAQKIGEKRFIYMENGSPRVEMEKTLVHELTHQWQYENWDDEFMRDPKNLPIVEGMAEWSAGQYLASSGLTERAEDFVRAETRRNDEYGIGLRIFLKSYPIRNAQPGHTPFELKGNPLKGKKDLK